MTSNRKTQKKFKEWSTFPLVPTGGTCVYMFYMLIFAVDGIIHQISLDYSAIFLHGHNIYWFFPHRFYFSITRRSWISLSAGRVKC